MSKKDIELRPYQEECEQKIEEKGEGKWLVAVAVGLGKTVIFTHMPRHGRTLILSHRDELVRQPQEYYDDSVSFGVEKADEHANGEDIVSASVQSLSRDNRLERYSPDDFDTIIIDECFPAGTLVDGMPIETIKTGDMVSAFNHQTLKCEKKKVTHVFKRPLPKEFVNINKHLTCTSNHPIFVVGKGYLDAKKVSVGDKLLVKSILEEKAETLTVSSIDIYEHGSKEYAEVSNRRYVYNLEIEDFNNYFANGILVHNCHHAAAPSYKKILDYFTGAKRRIGFTATPKRGDGVRLTDVFDEIIYERDLKWGIENGYLSRIRCIRVESDYDLSDVKKQAGDFNLKELETAIKNSNMEMTAAKTYVETCQDRHTLIYCVTKSICYSLQKLLRKMLPKEKRDGIQVLTGETPEDERRGMLEKFMSGEVPCIINCMVLTEGTDLPIADTIINMRPTMNPSLYQQIVGRGTRLYADKDYNLVIDIIPKNKKGKARSLCSAPTLFGIDPARLNKKQEKRLTQNNDLLDVCSEINGFYASVAQSIHLKIEEIDAFLSETEQILRKNRSNSMKVLADNFESLQEEKRKNAGNWDFKNLIFEIQPSENRYYRIAPSWNEEITLSMPDVLGNTTVDFALYLDPYNTRGQMRHHNIGEMKMEDAISLVRMFCETHRQNFAYMWDKDTNDKWAMQASTEKQQGKIRYEYKNLGMLYTGAKSVNKRDASMLIDISKKLKEKKEQKALLEKEAVELNSDSSLDALEKREKEKKELEQFGRAGFENFKRNVISDYQKEKKYEQEQSEWEEKLFDMDEYGEYILAKGATTRIGGIASDRQIDFMQDLFKKANDAGYVFPPKFVPTMVSKRQASGLIGTFKVLAKNKQTVKIMIDEESFDGYMKVLNRADTRPFRLYFKREKNK